MPAKYSRMLLNQKDLMGLSLERLNGVIEEGTSQLAEFINRVELCSPATTSVSLGMA